MNESILDTIKKMLGLDAEYEAFDVDIISDINAVLMILEQLGVCESGFLVTDRSQLWLDLIGDNPSLIAVKTYVYLKVRLMFDPPTSSFVADSINKQISELEWRLLMQVEARPSEEV